MWWYKKNSFYYEGLKEYFTYFSDVEVLIYEEFFNDPQLHFNNILKDIPIFKMLTQ